MILLLRVWFKKPTSFKNPENDYYINLMLTNSPNSFQNSCAIEIGLSDFHKITATILKIKLEKQNPEYNTIETIKLKLCPMIDLKEYLLSKLPMENISPSEQGFPHGVSWWGNILTITKNCMKIAKAVFIDR